MAADDIVKIVNIINRYAIAVDTRSWDLFDEVFTEDVEADFGGGAAWTDRASFKAAFGPIHDMFKSTQHITTNHQVIVKGDKANAVTYVHGFFVRDMPEGGDLFESTGYYDDGLVRTADGWRIRKRICNMVWYRGNPQVMSPSPDIKVAYELKPLHGETRAGRIDFMKALAGK